MAALPTSRDSLTTWSLNSRVYLFRFMFAPPAFKGTRLRHLFTIMVEAEPIDSKQSSIEPSFMGFVNKERVASASPFFVKSGN